MSDEQPVTDEVPAGSRASDPRSGGPGLADQVATLLAGLDGQPTAQHADTYAALHTRLQRALGDLHGE